MTVMINKKVIMNQFNEMVDKKYLPETITIAFQTLTLEILTDIREILIDIRKNKK